ncbi:MAG TPA: formimidoylglutamate deiminase [Candidatus Dormibacteraeota bacterium]
MSSFWAEDAWLGRPARRVLVEVDGERISTLREDTDPPPAATRLPGLLLPGLANAHSHAFQRALRAAAEGAGPTFWEWRQAMYDVAAKLRPDSYRRLAQAVYGEMALAGITAVGEFHYLHHQPGGEPYADPNEMGEALIDAAREAGVRLTLLDACYLRGGAGRPLEGAQLRFGDGDAERWRDRVERLAPTPGARIGAAIHSGRAVDEASMGVVAAWAQERGAPLHMHLLERREELADDPLEAAENAGVLGPGTTVIHATHAGGGFERLVESGTGICLCRTTERFLADGHVDGLEPWRAQARLSLGTDSHASVDIFEEARAVELDHRSRAETRGLYTADLLLEAATAGGYAALGQQGGRLEPGQLADFICVDMSSPRTAAAAPAAAVLVFAASATDVTDVVVGGRHVVRDRQHQTIPDVGRELREAIAAL